MRLRAFVPVLLLVLPVLLAGCFDGDEGKPRLAQPTTVPAGPTPPPTLTNPVVQLDFKDPGYRMNATWSVGDAWDWESDKGRYMTLRVLEARQEGNRTLYLVEETAGHGRNPPNSRQRSWIDGSTWMRLNVTDVQGFLTTFAPGQPLRYLKNGSYNYTERTFDHAGRVVENTSVAANVAYVNNDVVIRLPWGNVATGKLDHRILTTDKDKNRVRTQVTHWVNRDLANDVQFQYNLEETFTLTAAKVNGRTFREPRST